MWKSKIKSLIITSYPCGCGEPGVEHPWNGGRGGGGICVARALEDGDGEVVGKGETICGCWKVLVKSGSVGERVFIKFISFSGL